MDTRLCENVYVLADADLLVIESTFLDAQAELTAAYGHLTAGQAARVATECGVRRLVLTHFSQRFDDPTVFAIEAAPHSPTGIRPSRTSTTNLDARHRFELVS